MGTPEGSGSKQDLPLLLCQLPSAQNEEKWEMTSPPGTADNPARMDDDEYGAKIASLPKLIPLATHGFDVMNLTIPSSLGKYRRSRTAKIPRAPCSLPVGRSFPLAGCSPRSPWAI